MSDDRPPGRYVCATCGEAWARADMMRPSEALAMARDHACEGDEDPRFDAGLSADDYEVDFGEGSA